MWEIGERVDIGWPDFGRPPVPYEVVDVDDFGQVVRARVQDGSGRQGGFLVVYDEDESVLELLAKEASEALGFPVVVSELSCSIDGRVLRSFDYEWWPTPTYEERPRLLARTISVLLERMKRA
jgi:hypothetical protein